MTRFFTTFCCLFVSSLGLLGQSTVTSRTEGGVIRGRPNIIWIYADDHAFQAISAYHDRFADLAPTPNIDRIAHEGALFKHSYVVNSICAPARANILTGVHSHKNGVLDNRTPISFDQPTFPAILREHGYTTAVFGKWHIKTKPEGFDEFKILIGQGQYFNPDYRVKDGDGEKTVVLKGHSTDRTTTEAIEFIKANKDSGKPFMVMCQYKAPHGPWSPAMRNMKLLSDVEIPEPPTFYDGYRGRKAAAMSKMSISGNMVGERFDRLLKGDPAKAHYSRLSEEELQRAVHFYAYENRKITGGNLRETALKKEKYQRYIHDYLRTVQGNDQNVGRILDFLDESGLAENTLVCYSSDQGFYLGEHGWYDKRFMYNESFFTPLLMRWPGHIEAGTIVEELVQNIDIAPTFLSLGKAPVPEVMQGEDLTPLLYGIKPQQWRSHVYYHFYESYDTTHAVPKHEGVFDGRYKLIHFYELGEWEFFDCAADPYEMHNRINDPNSIARIAELKVELARLKRQYEVVEPS